jgi:hypothetical protein
MPTRRQTVEALERPVEKPLGCHRLPRTSSSGITPASNGRIEHASQYFCYQLLSVGLESSLKVRVLSTW